MTPEDMGPFQNLSNVKSLIFDIDYFQINYTVYSVNKKANLETYMMKWNIYTNFDVSTDNICEVTLNIQRQVAQESTFVMYTFFAKFTIVAVLLLSVISLLLNINSYLKIAKVFNRIKSKYEKQPTQDTILSSPIQNRRLSALQAANQEFKISALNVDKKDKAFRSEKEFL